jgi:hypothetical protein
MSILRKSQRREKYTNSWEPKSLLFKLATVPKQIQQLITIFYPIILWNIIIEVYCIIEKNNKNCYKRFHYVRGSKSIELGKKVACIYCQDAINYYFYY